MKYLDPQYNTLPQQVQQNKDNIETIGETYDEVVEALEKVQDYDTRITEAEAAATDAKGIATTASITAEDAKTTADSISGVANEALSVANSASLLATNADVNASTATETANTAKSMAETNAAAIDALGEFDAEAIANLTKTVEAQGLEISTVVAQVDSAEEDITNMKVTIASNTTSANNAITIGTNATSIADEALTKANDNAQSIDSLNDDLMDLENRVDELDYTEYSFESTLTTDYMETPGIREYSRVDVFLMVKGSSTSTGYDYSNYVSILPKEVTTGTAYASIPIIGSTSVYGFIRGFISSSYDRFYPCTTQVSLGSTTLFSVLSYGYKVVLRCYK